MLSRADLWDIWRAGVMPTYRLWRCGRRTGISLSDLLLLARVQRRMDALRQRAETERQRTANLGGSDA